MSAQEAPGDEFTRYTFLRSITKDTPHRRAVEARWTAAVLARRWDLADAIWDHLWPGVFPVDPSLELG